MTNEEFEVLLKEHDWYYVFSDAFNEQSSKRYGKGLAEETRIKKLCENNEEFKSLYQKYFNEKFGKKEKTNEV
jgi:hypothetical protein